MTPFLWAVATVISTALGGIFCLRNKSRLDLIMGFTAGVLLGVVSFEILPEIMAAVQRTGADPRHAMIALVVGFLVFHAVEKLVLIHHAHEADYAAHHHPEVGAISALALVAHSFLDGVGIGLGFQVNHAIGTMVAIAVIAHDFTDGMNTVALMLAHSNTERRARWFLAFDALAPMLGALSTMVWQLPEEALVPYLGFFAGFLLYIGTSDILPQAHSRRSSWATIALTVGGALFVYLLTGVV